MPTAHQGSDPLHPAPAIPPASPARRRYGLRRLATFLLVLYSALLVMLGFFQRSLLYHPNRATAITLADSGLPPQQVTEVTVPGHDGTPLHGWLALTRPAATPGEIIPMLRASTAPVILYFQGNAGNRLRNAGIMGELTRFGFHILYVDYRGYGLNAGSPTEADLTQDGRAIWNYLREVVKIPPERILLFGESLGGGVATAVARAVCLDGDSPAGLILGSTFSSVRRVASLRYPIFPVRWMLLDPFLSSERIVDVTCPLLQFHGTADSIVPVSVGRELFAAMPPRSRSGVEKKYVEIDGGEHYDVPPETLQSELRAFAHACGCACAPPSL